ncbi:MAG: hypothetical protein SCARUB_05143, partial [Candidatus Scalindua rubra]
MRRQNLLGVLVALLFAYPMMLPGSGSAEEWAEAMFTDAVAPDKSLLPEFTDPYG